MQTVELEAILRRARLGEQAALTELHRLFAPRVLGLCRHMLGRVEFAEDASNEIFLRLPQVIESFDGSIPFERWLFKIAGNHCIDLLRKRTREQKLIADRC